MYVSKNYKYLIILLISILASCNNTKNDEQSVTTIEPVVENSDVINSIIQDLHDEKSGGDILENTAFYMKPDSVFVRYFRDSCDEIKIPNNRLDEYFEFDMSSISVYDFKDGKCEYINANECDENILQVLEKYKYSGCLLQYKSLAVSERFRKSLILKGKTKVDLWVILYNNMTYVIKCKRL